MKRFHLNILFPLLAVIVALAIPLAALADGDDPPPDAVAYLILDADSGTFDGATLTLTGLSDHLTSLVATPAFYAQGAPVDAFLPFWTMAGDAVAPLPAMLQVGELTAELDAAALEYDAEAATVAFAVTLDAVFAAGEETAKDDVPAAFSPARLVLMIDAPWLNTLEEHCAEGMRGGDRVIITPWSFLPPPPQRR
jgi:hypothetical protein